MSIGAYLLASFGAYAVGNVMVYGFGIGVANERGMKIDRLMRASPLPPLVFMLAKVLTALVFALLALVMLIGFGIVVGGIYQTPAVCAAVIARLLAGSSPAPCRSSRWGSRSATGRDTMPLRRSRT